MLLANSKTAFCILIRHISFEYLKKHNRYTSIYVSTLYWKTCMSLTEWASAAINRIMKRFSMYKVANRAFSFWRRRISRPWYRCRMRLLAGRARFLPEEWPRCVLWKHGWSRAAIQTVAVGTPFVKRRDERNRFCGNAQSRREAHFQVPSVYRSLRLDSLSFPSRRGAWNRQFVG